MIVDNDPGAGKPRTSSDEKSVSLVADALEVRGEFTVNRSTVSRWDNFFFHSGCVSTANDPRPGRPRTSTDERSVKLVADALEEDRQATCEELTRATGANTSRENAQEPTSVARGWAIYSP